MIELHTLGALDLTSADRTAARSVLAQPRRAALFCYLALAQPRGFHRRDTLFALFWPEDDADQARHALRQSLYFLRRALGAKTILSRGDEELALASDQVRCDVWEFDAAVEQGRPADALALYRGDLLAGFHISAAPDFERWLDEERSRLRQRAGETAWALAEARERAGDGPGAADAARRALSFCPTDETALRRLILLLERLGDRAAAVRAYEAFAWKLAGEYELEPSAETQAVLARIRAESGESQATVPGDHNGFPPTAGHPNSRTRTRVAELGVGRRPGVGTPLPQAGRQSEDVLTDPTPASSSSGSRRLVATVAGLTVLLLLLVAGLYVRTQASHRAIVAAPTSAEAAPGVAVLPFAVQDRALASWRESLVDLVSMDLAGVAGLRPVDSRTLLARWRERVRGPDVPELATALEVAERAGARYAVVGSVISSGPDLLLTATVHEVGHARMIGTARSQGAADSIFTLVDQLTLEILRLILRGEAGELPRIDLARVSTPSLPALKSYLEGEVLFRRSQFHRAAQAYVKAVEADSTFVLARYRLGLSKWWIGDPSGAPPNPWYAELGQLAERLPRHEAAILRANQLREHDIRAARLLLEQEVRLHPDDAESWHELGELYHHDGAPALVPVDAADRAFTRAIELDSTFTLPYIHLIERAIAAADTTKAIRLLRTFSRLAPESPYSRLFSVATRLAFGDSAARSAAQATQDSLESPDLLGLGVMLEGPGCCWRLAEQILRKARERPEVRPNATHELFWISLAQGKAREALEWLDDPFMPEKAKLKLLHALDELGLPIPSARLESTIALAEADSANAVQLFYAGSFAARRARWEELRSVLEGLQARAERLRAAGDSSEAGFTEAVRQGLEGYARWRRGQRDGAVRLLEQSQRRIGGDWSRQAINIRLRWWLGQLLVEMGRPRQALPYFESLTATALPADYECGRIYEQLGELEPAREAYARFLGPKQHSDPAFQRMIRHARGALRRLTIAIRD